MRTCKWCGKKFDVEEAEMDFNAEFSHLSYDNFKKCLCGDCAIRAIEDEEYGVYFEQCEECGRTFDYIKDDDTFKSNFDEDSGKSLTDYWGDKILCCDCALKIVEDDDDYDDFDDENYEDDEDDEDDEDGGEISVYDAALIWARAP